MNLFNVTMYYWYSLFSCNSLFCLVH